MTGNISNGTRAEWAAVAISAFERVCRMGGEPAETKAKDLITNLIHYLRLDCGKSFDEAKEIADKAIFMAEIEMNEDED